MKRDALAVAGVVFLTFAVTNDQAFAEGSAPSVQYFTLYDHQDVPMPCDVRTHVALDLVQMTASVTSETVGPCAFDVFEYPRNYDLTWTAKAACSATYVGTHGIDEIEIQWAWACEGKEPSMVVQEYYQSFNRTYYGSGVPQLTVPVRFEYEVYAGEECEKAQAQGVNCVQVLELCRDGKAVWMLTDMPTLGEYEVHGSQVVTKWTVGGDVEDDARFTLDSNGNMTQQGLDKVWVKADGPMSWCE